MTLLIWLGVIVIVAGGAYLLVLQQRGALSGSKSKELPSLKRNVFNLQIGDIVQHMGIDWVVEGILTYAVGEYTWFEYMLQDDNEIRWLSVDVANMTREGTVQRRTASRWQYFDYKGPGDKVLSIEVWDGETEVTVGYRINPRSLTILPGDGNRIYGM